MQRDMSGVSTTKEAYKESILNENWDAMEKYFTKENLFSLLIPLTVAQDSVFHIAVYSKTNQPLQHLLKISEEDELTEGAYTVKNAYGNTALHQAAMVGNFEAVRLLVEKDGDEDLLKDTNNLGETPLFTAAKYGSTKIVNFLATQPGQMTPAGELEIIHRQRQSSSSEPGELILHATIQGEHFGTALELLKLDASLAIEEDKGGMSSLQLLANIPSAFRSGYPMGSLEKLIYWCLPVFEDNNDDPDGITGHYKKDGETKVSSRDTETGLTNVDDDQLKGSHGIILTISNMFGQYFWRICQYFWRIRQYFWRILLHEQPKMGKLWKQKRKHKFALRLAKLLIEGDYTWELSLAADSDSYTRAIGAKEVNVSKPEVIKISKMNKQTEVEHPRTKLESGKEKEGESKHPNSLVQLETPLLVATRKGIIEIVDEIIRVHPQAVEHYSHQLQNILHVAVLHRQKEIFDLMKKMKLPMSRLVAGIDKNGYTILHCAADKEHHTGGTRPGPAYQLQDELNWFKRVEKLVPPHFPMHCDKKSKTAKQLFEEQHQKQLEDAQKWIKDTSQSCSAVAVLVSTVVFAAAYTVPGGSNERGFPNFLHSPIFLFFTIMDVVSLASSLTSVVLFLSILSSPFDYEYFHRSLPRKLTFGFALLFFSVVTTMLAFTATILMVIRLDPRRWTSTLVYTAAFFPVAILALSQFHLYFAFVETLMNITKAIGKILPLNLARRLFPIHSLFPKRKKGLVSN